MKPCPCSQLQPYGFGDIHWAAAHVLAMTGAFFGCLLVSAYQFEGLVIGAHLGDGYRIEGVCCLLSFLSQDSCHNIRSLSGACYSESPHYPFEAVMVFIESP